MNVLLLASLLFLVIVGAILASAQEIGKGGEAVKSIITLVVLCGLSGFFTALASGSL